jgi:hypothetical protein
MSKKTKKQAPKPSTLLAQAFKLFGSKGERWIKGEEKIKPGNPSDNDFSNNPKIYPEGAYCSIGAMHEVDTKNEEEAILYLRAAMASDYKQGSKLDDEIIETLNDNHKTKFKDIRRWFTRAIKLAKAVGR